MGSYVGWDARPAGTVCLQCRIASWERIRYSLESLSRAMREWIDSQQSPHSLPSRSAPTQVNLVYASNRLVPLKLRAFLDFAVPRLVCPTKNRYLAKTLMTSVFAGALRSGLIPTPVESFGFLGEVAILVSTA